MKEEVNNKVEISSEIIRLRNLLNQKKEFIKEKKVNSKKNKYLNAIIVFLVFTLFLVLYINIKKVNTKPKKNSELYAYYLDKKQKDSIRLFNINTKIEKFKEKRAIDSILEEIRISDSLAFENNEVAKVFFKYSDKTNKSKLSGVKKKNTKDVIKKTFKDYNIIKKQSNIEEVSTEVKKEKYYSSTDKFAVYPGCERKKGEVKKRKCFNSKLNKFISKNIRKKMFKEKGIKRIDVLVAITKEGYLKVLKIITNLNTKLHSEIIRVLESVPRFTAAIENNNKVGVQFNLPIVL